MSATVPGRALRLFMTADAVGGVWTYALDLAAALVPHGIETTLAVLGPEPAAAECARAAALPGLRLLITGLPLDWLAETPAAVAGAGAALAAAARRAGADIVHLNSPALAGHGDFGAPVVAACHSCLATWWAAMDDGPMPPDFAWRTALVGNGLRAADACIAPTRAFAAATARAYDMPLPPLAVHNGRAAPLPQAGPAEPGEAVVFTAGRLWDRAKNVATLDRAAALIGLPLEAAGPVAGPEGSRVALRNARLLGSLDPAAMRARLARRPIFASTARYEPFGLTVLEAAQAGCPLVLSDIPTFRELWTGAALHVPALDPAAVSLALGQLAADPALRRRMGMAALRRARRLTPAAMAAGTAGIYGALLGGFPWRASIGRSLPDRRARGAGPRGGARMGAGA